MSGEGQPDKISAAWDDSWHVAPPSGAAELAGDPLASGVPVGLRPDQEAAGILAATEEDQRTRSAGPALPENDQYPAPAGRSWSGGWGD